mgnify:CR=1 FL=1
MRLAVALRRRLSEAFTLDVTFDVHWAAEQRIAGVFGPSGCGKTTTLALLAGLARPDAGRIALGERVLHDAASRVDVPPHARAVGLVAQDALLFPHLDVRANVEYGARRRAARAAPSFDDVVDALRLAALLGRPVDALSGGERQRVALARALRSGPELLLLDEPVSALDEASRWEALGLIESVTRAFAVPALFVSHRRDELLRLAATVVRLDAGRVVAVGAPSAVLAPARDDTHAVPNVFRVEVRDDGSVSPAPGVALHLAVPAARGAPLWCRLSSAAIALELPGPETPSSVRNRLRGTVVALESAPGRVRVAVDVGIPLLADVTADAARALGLAPGATVLCAFKAHALEVLA